jgi:hypothetical protein
VRLVTKNAVDILSFGNADEATFMFGQFCATVIASNASVSLSPQPND